MSRRYGRFVDMRTIQRRMYVLRIEGTKWFTKKGVRYINGRFPVRFVRT